MCRQIGVPEQIYDRWRRDDVELRVDQARRLKELKQETARAKHPVADRTLEEVDPERGR